MNYLAHAYLSMNNSDLLIGNMIGDFVKGKQLEKYPAEIQSGIILHRKIDEFTDKHPVVKQAKLVFREAADRYDGSFLDIAYDHFLATDKKREPHTGWKNFSKWCYLETDKNLNLLPEMFQRLYHYMKEEDWLYNYRDTDLIKESFEHLVKRARYLPDGRDVFSFFLSNYKTIEDSYNVFFPELEIYVKNISF